MCRKLWRISISHSNFNRHLVGAVNVSLKGLLLLVFLSLIIGSSGAGAYQVGQVGPVGQAGQVDDSNTLSQSRVVFLEHNLISNGTVLSGEVPFRSVNFPNYWFNENTRQLNGKLDFAVNDSLIAIFGDSLTLIGDFGAGTGNKLYGIYSLPITADHARIYTIDQFGTIGMYVNNRSVFLRPGQEYSFNESETIREDGGNVNIQYKHLYINRGIIEKNAITARMVT